MSLDGQLAPSFHDALPAMAAAIRHRGPDGDGFFCDDVVGLAHRRLSIIDLSGGAQPMHNEDSSCWIVFNGEIYNHRELRRTLVSLGHTYQTASDTETILHAYEQYGESCVDHLEGMFAFAIYDQSRRELFLARDRIGKKPLFYGVISGVFHFASEIKALYRSPVWVGDADLSALEAYFSLGYFVAPDTVYRDIRKLQPGHWLRVGRGGVETREYWDIREFDTDSRPESVVLEDLESRLRDSVAERLESEVPLGAFLSGGIDSGLVVSYMTEVSDQPPITISVGFGEPAFNELDSAALTARHFRTEHHAATIEPKVDNVIAGIASAFDEPFADSSAIPTYYVCGAARQFVTVALSGDGGDELFAGYDFRYVPHAIEQAARRLVPGQAGRTVFGALGHYWPRSQRLPKALRLGTILDNLSRDPADAYYSDLCFVKPPVVRRLLGLDPDADPKRSPVYDAVTAPYRRCASTSAVQCAEYADLKVYLPNAPLVKVDRMSMQHGLEVRCPLLDRRVVEFAFRLPARVKMAHLRGKHLLRTLAARRLPAGISTLPKSGFAAPVGTWIRGPYAESFRNEVLGAQATVRSLIDVRWLGHLFERHRLGVADNSALLWAVWMLERWKTMQHGKRPQAADGAVHERPIVNGRAR